METRPDSPAPPEWGTYRPSGYARFLTGLTRAIPGWPLIKQLAFPIRKLARKRMHGPVDAELWGQRLRFEPHGNISEGRLLFMPANWDRRERAIMAAHARPGTTFVDVGCNFGGYTWWMLSLLGKDCRIVALEPDPELNARLRFNLDTNGWDHVTLLPYAAGGSDGTATLHIHGVNRGENTLLEVEGEVEAGAVEVPLRTLESVLRETGTDRVDILKIDIEGLEPPVLHAFFDNADPSLWPSLVFCERKDTPEHDELERFIVDKGYALEARTRLNMVLKRVTG